MSVKYWNAQNGEQTLSAADIIALGFTPGGPGSNGVVGVGTGYKVARGAIALDASNPTPVATGLTTIVAAVAVLKGAVAPGLGTCNVTVDFSGSDGTLNLYGWKPTAANDCTLIASAGTETVEWIAVGT